MSSSEDRSRTAIVTGGGTGIGRATARALADQDYEVLIIGRTASALDATANRHTHVHTLAVDITDSEALELIAKTARQRLGRVDILVNNAALGRFGDIASLERESAEAQIQTNLLAPIVLTQSLLGQLESAEGLVVNISSAGALGLRSWPENGVYGATKAALDFLTRTWAIELAPRGIRVVGVAPGVINTGVGIRAGMSEESYAGMLEDMAGRIPVGRIGTPEEIAWWITHLASPDASYVSGTVLAVDGALSVT